MAKIGVLVMSYGSPKDMESIEEYYTNIRHGHAPTQEQLEDLQKRYAAVSGGIFPLREHTNAQVTGLASALESAYPGQFAVYQGLKHAAPFIEDGIAAMQAAGIHHAISIVLAPHYSVMSIGDYNKRAAAAAQSAGISLHSVRDYHMHPQLIEAHVLRVQEQLAHFDLTKPLRVIFSAHSLPERIRAMGDVYEEQLLETSRAVASAAGVTDWSFTWQSAGRTREPWLGPDILDALVTVAGEGYGQILSVPLGFVSDHLEVLYDLDIEAMKKASGLGVHYARTAMLNDDPLYMHVLADSVAEMSKQTLM